MEFTILTRYTQTMGSFPWKTVTDYQPEVHVALERAQAEVFERGEYGYVHKMKKAFAAIGKEYVPRVTEPTARDIAHARELAAESGTSSVLDVYKLGASTAVGVAAPLAPKVLKKAFGSETPTLEEIDAGLSAVYQKLARGAAAYITAYEDGRPKHLVFVGMSFD